MDTKLKKKAAQHILYEMEMFNFTYTKSKEKNRGMLHNALLESLVMHAGNLCQFLYHEKRKYTSDIIASDFLNNDEMKYFVQNRTPADLFNELENKRNKEVAHLTYDRITMMRGWNTELFDGLWDSAHVFIDSLSEDLKKEWRSVQQKAIKNVESR